MSNDHIVVRVGKLPGTISEVALNGDRSVSTALDAAGLDPSGYQIRVNGDEVTPSHNLRSNDLVLLVQNIKGNA